MPAFVKYNSINRIARLSIFVIFSLFSLRTLDRSMFITKFVELNFIIWLFFSCTKGNKVFLEIVTNIRLILMLHLVHMHSQTFLWANQEIFSFSSKDRWISFFYKKGCQFLLKYPSRHLWSKCWVVNQWKKFF